MLIIVLPSFVFILSKPNHKFTPIYLHLYFREHCLSILYIRNRQEFLLVILVTPSFSGVRVTRCLVLCVMFCRSCGHCVVYDDFWFLLSCLQSSKSDIRFTQNICLSYLKSRQIKFISWKIPLKYQINSVSNTCTSKIKFDKLFISMQKAV